ncbi:protoporphyrinogen oxidase [Parachlamydia sp.]|uniref:protoporphyrinogen oxidase n=1 Tax=Parachlamydia sp. TaxID=2052048 RepID=UPI003D0E67EE
MTVKKPHIVILGAGISGLTLAWSLKQRLGTNIHISILEKENRSGGYMHTHHQDGFLFEYGPRSCRPSGAGLETLKLIESLQLQNDIITENVEAKKRYLWKDQTLHPLPNGFFSFLTSPLTKKTIWPIAREFLRPKTKVADESIFSFFNRRFSPEIAETLIDPLVNGIYAGDIRKLSIRSCFPLFHEMEQTYGSLVKGFLLSPKKSYSLSDFQSKMQKTSLFSFRKGIETLPKELSKHLTAELKLNHTVTALNFDHDAIRIQLNDKRSLEANYLFSTLPSHALAKLTDHAPFIEQLTSIPHVPIAVVNLGWHQPILKQQGFGFLIPSREKEKILGIVWDSSVFPTQNTIPNQTRLTVMIGGALFCPHHFATLDASQFIALACKAVEKHLDIFQPPDTCAVKIIPQAIPQYLVGHHEKVKMIQQIAANIHPHFQVLGSSFFGVSVNDCIKKSVDVADYFHKNANKKS